MRLAEALARRVEPGVGEKARVIGGWEIIGPVACPILARRTLVEFGKLGKVLWHSFLPNASDKDCHDHPRPFVTIAIRGGYDDVQPDGTVDHVRAPAIRYRPAEHAHITRVGPLGCTTLCIMGPVRRAWGFWRDGGWWEWRDYERRFGLNFRCEQSPAEKTVTKRGQEIDRQAMRADAAEARVTELEAALEQVRASLEVAKLRHSALSLATDDGDDYGDHVGLQRHRRAVLTGQGEILALWEEAVGPLLPEPPPLPPRLYGGEEG